MKGKLDAAKLAVAFTVAIAGVDHIVGIFGVKRNQAQTVGDELVCKNAAVLLYLNQVDGYSRNFGKDNATQGVCQAKVNIGKVKIDMVVVSLLAAGGMLENPHLLLQQRMFRLCPEDAILPL